MEFVSKKNGICDFDGWEWDGWVMDEHAKLEKKTSQFLLISTSCSVPKRNANIDSEL